MTPLLNSEDHRISGHFQPAGSGTLVISFNQMRMGLADKGFGSEFILSKGHDHIFVAEGGNSHYQFLSQEQFAQTVAPVAANYDRVFLYGYDLGGYAALFYSGSVSGTAVALAPRLAAHPSFARHLTEAEQASFRDCLILHPDMALVADPAARPIVLFDPRSTPDADFVARFVSANWPKRREVPLPGAGHRVPQILAYQGLLDPVLSHVFATGEVPEFHYDMNYLPLRHMTKALKALEQGEFVRAGRLLGQLAAAPETPGFQDASAYWEEKTGKSLEKKLRKRPAKGTNSLAARPPKAAKADKGAKGAKRKSPPQRPPLA